MFVDTAPPKQVLTILDTTLVKCGLVPASIVYCGPVGPRQGLKTFVATSSMLHGSDVWGAYRCSYK